MATSTLTDLQTRILDFEATREGRRGSKEHAVRVEFGWRLAAYELRLQLLLREPAAERVYPQLVHRATRLRDARVEKRAARTFAS